MGRFSESLAATLGVAAIVWCVGATEAWAYDELSDRRSPPRFVLNSGDAALHIKGELELELHDLSGRGGARFDSPTDTRTIGTRSLFLEVDTFYLKLRADLPHALVIHTGLDASPRAVRLGEAYVTWSTSAPEWLSHAVSFGYAPSILAIDRRSERYPLAATIYWREPELRLAYEGWATLGESLGVGAGASFGLTRPIHFAAIQDSQSQRGTINILAYGAADVFSGLAPTGTAYLRASGWGVSLWLFGSIGQLSLERGTAELRAALPAFQELDRPTAGANQFRWGGGRLAYDGYRLHLVGEVVAGQESRIKRLTTYAQASFEIPILEGDLLPVVEPLVRGELYRLHDGARLLPSGQALRSPAPSLAPAWDWDVLTFGLIVPVVRHLFTVRVEYDVIAEHNGVPALGVADSPFDNNELRVQLEGRF